MPINRPFASLHIMYLPLGFSCVLVVIVRLMSCTSFVCVGLSIQLHTSRSDPDVDREDEVVAFCRMGCGREPLDVEIEEIGLRNGERDVKAYVSLPTPAVCVLHCICVPCVM